MNEVCPVSLPFVPRLCDLLYSAPSRACLHWWPETHSHHPKYYIQDVPMGDSQTAGQLQCQ
jgi:hypothetical protein